jgi:hypothetical protein
MDTEYVYDKIKLDEGKGLIFLLKKDRYPWLWDIISECPHWEIRSFERILHWSVVTYRWWRLTTNYNSEHGIRSLPALRNYSIQDTIRTNLTKEDIWHPSLSRKDFNYNWSSTCTIQACSGHVCDGVIHTSKVKGPTFSTEGNKESHGLTTHSTLSRQWPAVYVATFISLERGWKENR